MNNLVFIPVKEEYYPTEFNIYMTIFELGGFLPLNFGLIDQSIIKLRKEYRDMIEKTNPTLNKRYLDLLTIGGKGWIWYAHNQLKPVEMEYKRVIQTLKNGDRIELKDLSKRSNPIRISHKGMEFEW